jgi:transposase
MLPPSVKVYLAAEPTDLRRGHDGLCASVRATLGRDPYAGHLFVFIGRRVDRIKILFWDRGGFVVYYKRLEKGRFRMPAITASAKQIELDATSLAMLLDGIDLRQIRRPEHWDPGPRT